jgi:hypothetical protein
VALALAAVVALGVGVAVSLRSGALKSEIAASAAEEHATLAAAPSGHRALIATPHSAITVHANAAIRELRVDARPIRIHKPSATLTLAEGCRAGALLEAQSSDGRRASTHVPKDAREVRLEFPSPGARGRAALRRAPASCRPPYFFDAEGVKHLRPECL